MKNNSTNSVASKQPENGSSSSVVSEAVSQAAGLNQFYKKKILLNIASTTTAISDCDGVEYAMGFLAYEQIPCLKRDSNLLTPGEKPKSYSLVHDGRHPTNL